MFSSGKIQRVIHRELLGTFFTQGTQAGWAVGVLSSLGLANSGVFRLNAGSESTHPWLASVARNYEFFRYRRLSFRYIPRCPTTQAGNIMFTPDYDAEDANPTTEQAAAMNVDSVEAIPFRACRMNLDPAKMNAMYKRHTCMSDTRFPTTSQDTKTVDAGKVILSSDIIAGGTPVLLGKIWVEYDVELSVPQNPNTTTASSAIFSARTIIPNTPNSLPAVFVPDFVNQKNPFLQPLNNSITGPFIGQFVRNCEGIVRMVLNGTGITAIAAPVVANAAGGFASLAPTPAFAGGPLINAGATQAVMEWFLPQSVGVTGNQIKIGTITAATLTALSQHLNVLNWDPVGATGNPPINDL